MLVLRFVLLTPYQAVAFLKSFGYWAVAAIVITTAWVCLKAFRGWKFSAVLHGGPLVAALACAAFLQIHEPRKLRVMYDEYVLVATSLQMHLIREATVPNEAHYNNGNIIHTGSHVDKRPLLFAFLLSLVHDVSGYRVSNVFVLNSIVSIGLFWMVFWLGEAIGGRRFGYAGMLLLAGIPLVANVATSGAYDLLNLTLLAALMLAARRYAEEPTDANQNLLVITGVLIAQARYESILFLLSLAAIVAIAWWRNGRLEVTRLAVASPLMLLVPLLINFVYVSNDAFFENKKLGVAFFDVANLPRNLSHAVYFFFDFSGNLTNSPLVSFTGFAALLLMIVGARTLLKKEFARPHVSFVLFAFLPIIVGNTVMILANFWGQFEDPMASRFSLPLQLFMVLAILVGVAQFKAQGRAVTVLTVIAGFSIWAWAIPTSGRHHATSRMFASMAVEWQVSQALERFDFRTLVVADSALPLVVNRRPVIPFVAFSRSPQSYLDLPTKGDYDQVVFYEMLRVDPETGVETPEAYVPPPTNMILEPLFETRFFEGYVSRFSRLVGLEKGPIEAAPDEPAVVPAEIPGEAPPAP